jgi:hypothetical protein
MPVKLIEQAMQGNIHAGRATTRRGGVLTVTRHGTNVLLRVRPARRTIQIPLPGEGGGSAELPPAS